MKKLNLEPGHSIDPKGIKIRPTAKYSTAPSCLPPESDENGKGIDSKQKSPDLTFSLDDAQPLNLESFPNQPYKGTGRIPATIPNLRYMLSKYEIAIRYDVIKKKLRINVPGFSGCPDNADNSTMTQIISLATLNNVPTSHIPSYVEAIGDRNQVNPVADWITSKPWDGTDRCQALCETLVAGEDYPNRLKEVLLYRWLLSAVAAALMPSGFRARGVLTLQGPQSIGKTAWVSALVGDSTLRDSVIKLDHHLDAGNKDSQITAICHWIVEIGELDSSFKKDVARLKGFITSDRDKVRRPYARADSEYQRRTIFCATVNDHNFLIDTTGNSRWWTIPVITIDYDHGIDMQQLFAQFAVDFHKGERWWLTQDEEELLEEQNKSHRSSSVIRERVEAILDLDMSIDKRPAMTSTDVLNKIGIENPSNPQFKECCAVLREFFGEAKKSQGQYKWRVALKEKQWPQSLNIDDDEY